MPKIVTDVDRDTRRHAIFAAAATEFARHGFDQANILTIAENAGIGKGTIYLSFENKHSLFVEMLADIAAMHTAAIATALASQPTLAEQLQALLHVFAQLAETEPDYFRIYMSALYGVNRRFQTEAATHYREYISLIEAVLRTAIAKGELEPQPVEPLSLVVLTATESLVLRALALDYPTAFIQEHSHAIITTLLFGLAPQTRG